MNGAAELGGLSTADRRRGGATIDGMNRARHSKSRMVNVWAFLLISLLPACRDADAGVAATSTTSGASEDLASSLPGVTTEAAARHLLQRFTFGPRIQDIRELSERGAAAWFEEQLAPEASEEAQLAGLPELYPLAYAEPLELRHPGVPREDEEALEPGAGEMARPINRAVVLRELQADLITRQTLTERQLLEVMTDFWFNHFNVSGRKGHVHFVVGDYLDHVIRRNALGRFDEMLVAVATHPAMLLYLDNAASSVERHGPRGLRGGINENFARELLELHTVGVDGGYSQADVEEVARVLSGWGIDDLGFAYRDALHDRGAKTVMGREFPEGGRLEEGVSLLRWLARHPSTARYLSRKLVMRFITDTPSEELVGRIAGVWTESEGDIPSVLRAIVASPEFWAEENRGAKVKTPNEWIVSSFRILGVEPSGLEVFRVGHRLGQPLLEQPLPTGYAEVADEWTVGAQLATRWQIAFQLANGRLPGVTYRPGEPLPEEVSYAELASFIGDSLLGGASPSTDQALRERLELVRDLEQRRILGVAMALSSPEFQRQ